MALEEFRGKRGFVKTPAPRPVRAKKAAAGAEKGLKRLMAQYPEVQLATLVQDEPSNQ
jgi:hypothetical protein